MKQLVKEVIEDTLLALKNAGTITYEAVPQYNVEVPKNPEHGDWSCNVAMVMSKATGKKPPELADLIADVDSGIESPLEARYHRIERLHGLPTAVLQERRVVDGGWIRADRVHPAYLLVIELDGNLAHRGGRALPH